MKFLEEVFYYFVKVSCVVYEEVNYPLPYLDFYLFLKFVHFVEQILH